MRWPRRPQAACRSAIPAAAWRRENSWAGVQSSGASSEQDKSLRRHSNDRMTTMNTQSSVQNESESVSANKAVALIGAPTDVGASDRGSSMGPEALRVAGLREALSGRGLRVTDRGNINGPGNPWQLPVEGYRHLSEVTNWNRLVHDAVYSTLNDGHLPILLGGDHCLGIGSISAVARFCREQGKKLHVFWLDAHAD